MEVNRGAWGEGDRGSPSCLGWNSRRASLVSSQSCARGIVRPARGTRVGTKSIKSQW